MILLIHMNYTNFTGCQPSNHYDLSRYIRKKVSCRKSEKRGKTSRQPLKKRGMERFKPILVSMASTTPQTPEEREAEARLERRLRWKIDMVILHLLALTYFLSKYPHAYDMLQVSRPRFGQCQRGRVSHDLGLTPKQYSNAASVFQVGYILLQIPGTVLVRKIGRPLLFGLAGLVVSNSTSTTFEIRTTG
jgi:hypothetical protein